MGVVHDVVQGEGGDEIDPLMPALFALGQHRALVAVRERLRPDEHLLAFLDDIYIVCRPDRVVHIHAMLRAHLCHHARIQIHQGKTQLILLFCTSARANFLLRALPPEATREFARQHDESLRTCLSELLGGQWTRGTLPVCHLPWMAWGSSAQRTPQVL